MNMNELESSVSMNKKLEGKTIEEMLPEVFQAVFDYLKPQFEKMKLEKSFKSLKAFGHLDSGFNRFELNIFGGALPDNSNIVQNPEAPPQDSEHFEENMRAMNDSLLQAVFEEMMKQNITGGAGAPIKAYSSVGILDEFYVFTLVWECFPQNFENMNPMAANAMNN